MFNLRDKSLATEKNFKDYLAGSPISSPFKVEKQGELITGVLQASNKYNLNSVYILSHAIWESDWGRSRIAKDKNNLFGYGADDKNPYENAWKFNNYEHCINTVMKRINEEYLTPGGVYFNGATLQGMNIKYASDKNWHKGIESLMKEFYIYCKLPLPVEAKTLISNSPSISYPLKNIECKYMFSDLSQSPPKIYYLSGEGQKKVLVLDLEQKTGAWLSENPVGKFVEQPQVTPKVEQVLKFCEQERLYGGQDFKEITGVNAGPQVKKYLNYVGLPEGNPWCAAFVCWVLGQCGIDNPKSGDTWELEKWAQFEHIYYSENPQSGDIFLQLDEQGKPKHTGFVKMVDPSDNRYLLTIEGNAGDSIKNCNDKKVAGCRYIRWQEKI